MENVARDNLIEKNHIYDIGQGMLSDMGGIYTLGVQPGTVLRGNLIHDVTRTHYGGWCIYPDEGSSHILIEKNICYGTNGEVFHQHYGRENILRNNIFAFGGDAQVNHSRIDPEHKGFTLERNIIVTDSVPAITSGYAASLSRHNIIADLNLYYDVHGKPVREQYEYYWPGAGGEKFNLVAGKNEATYTRPLPRKVRQYPKPEKLSYGVHTPLRLLEFRGPGAVKLKVMEAAEKVGFGDRRISYFSTDWSGGKCSLVPSGYEDVFSYDLFVLNGVSAQSLTDFGLQALRDFVTAGGSLLVFGGFYSLGPGGYADSQLAEVFPVKLGGKFYQDRLTAPAPVKVSSQARSLRGARWGGAPLCCWRQRVQPKEGAWTELTAGDKPFLVCGTYGKGRVAVVASAAFGDLQPGQTPLAREVAAEHPVLHLGGQAQRLGGAVGEVPDRDEVPLQGRHPQRRRELLLPAVGRHGPRRQAHDLGGVRMDAQAVPVGLDEHVHRQDHRVAHLLLHIGHREGRLTGADLRVHGPGLRELLHRRHERRRERRALPLARRPQRVRGGTAQLRRIVGRPAQRGVLLSRRRGHPLRGDARVDVHRQGRAHISGHRHPVVLPLLQPLLFG
jgi:hypothetical protein